ncbi:MAG: VanZ family protein [Bacteroidales bacterium]|nr:VanZ family protein [Bacteroidales bacterium]
MTKRLNAVFKVLFYLYLVAIAVLCFGSFNSLPNVSRTILGIPTDKVVHFCMFLPFPILAFLAYDKYTGDRRKVLLFALVTFLVGCLLAAGTELGQAYLTDHRSGDAWDFLADFLAILTGSVIAIWIDLRQLRK